MRADAERFLRDAHILARLVEQILEEGYLRAASGDRITFAQLNILKHLARPGEKLVKDVARFLRASYAAGSTAVSRLEKKKLLRRATSARDGRAEVVTVTDQGRRAIERYERLKQGRVEALLRGEDVESASRGLEQAIGLLMRDRQVAGNPCLACGVYYSKNCVARLFGASCPEDACRTPQPSRPRRNR